MTKIHVGGIGVFRKKFNTLEEASRAAKYGDDIILHKNVTVLGNCLITSGVCLEGNNHTITTTSGKLAILIKDAKRVEIRNIKFKVRKQSVALKILGSECSLENITMKYVKRYSPRELYPAIQVTTDEEMKSSVEIRRSTILTNLEMRKVEKIAIESCVIGDLLQNSMSIVECNNYKSQNTVYSNIYVKATTGSSIDDESNGNLLFADGTYTLKNLKAYLGLSDIKSRQLKYLKELMWDGTIRIEEIALVMFLNKGKFTVDNFSVELPQGTLEKLKELDDVACVAVSINNSDVTLRNSILSEAPAIFHSGTITLENVQDNLKWKYNPSKVTIANKNSNSSLIKVNGPKSVEKGMSALQEIDSQIGQDAVKRKLREIVSMAQQEVYQKRLAERTGQSYNPTNVFSNHMIFSGSAGTGKTTFARLVGKALFEAGVLPENKFTEASPKDLVAGYVGQTRTKTHDLILKSLGGVLFIDEAYGLNEDGQNSSFNKEAIEQLIADMENYRDRLIVIMAGYTKEMRNFIENGNEGLRSRFNNWVEFKDYRDSELNEILWSMLEQQNAIYSDEVTIMLFQDGICNLSHHISGNGRFVRNLVQKIMEKKALRLSYRTDIGSLDAKKQYEVLNTIESTDVEAAIKDMREQYNLL